MHKSSQAAIDVSRAIRGNFIKITAKSKVPDRDVFKMRFKPGSKWERRLTAIKRYCYSHPGEVYYHRRREDGQVVVRLWAEKHVEIFLLQCAKRAKDDSQDHIVGGAGNTSFEMWQPWQPRGRR